MTEPMWIVDIWFVLALFIILTILFHIVFVWAVWPFKLFEGLPFDEIAWKKADYFWIFLTSISLIAAVGEGRRLQAHNFYEWTRGYEESQSAWAVDKLEWASDYYCKIKDFVRGELSPPNWDWLVEQWKLSCQWFTAAEKIAREEMSKADPDLRPELFTDNPQISEQMVREDIQDFFRRARDAHDATQRRAKLRDESERSNFDVALVFFAPLLLAFAFALRLAKVSGEVQIAQKKRSNLPSPEVT